MGPPQCSLWAERAVLHAHLDQIPIDIRDRYLSLYEIVSSVLSLQVVFFLTSFSFGWWRGIVSFCTSVAVLDQQIIADSISEVRNEKCFFLKVIFDPLNFEPLPWQHQLKCKNHFKEVPLHALMTWNAFQFKHKNMTKVACFHGQHSSYLEGIQNTTRSACLCNYFERN